MTARPMIEPAMLRKVMRGGAALEPEECNCSLCNGAGSPPFRRQVPDIISARPRVSASGRAFVWL